MSGPESTSLKKSYQTTMEDMRYELKPSERLTSRLIHAPILTPLLSVITRLFLRPHSLIIGGIFAIITLGMLYLIARFHGYESSGIEPHLGFLLGWSCGLCLDAIRHLVPRSRHR